MGHGKCLYTYLYNSTYNASLICAFNMITHHVSLPRSDVWEGEFMILLFAFWGHKKAFVLLPHYASGLVSSPLKFYQFH